MVVGISPALVMFMVGSLLWFLTIVFYQGDYTWRLLLVHAMFIMGCVSVTRLSMEQGAAYAALFAFPLAAVVAVAYVTLVKVNGPLAAISPLINLMLEGIIWFSAHKLTRDCTLIDDTQDSSKQGLLQAMGWDRAAREIEPPPSPPVVREADDDAVSQPAAPSEAPLSGEAKLIEWVKSRFQPDKRPHTPGVWIVYFSVAALPLFGIGQWFIPGDEIELRRQAFWLLVVYVACGLGLLLNTSFLGLRRYLRQRNLQMPTEMAATWLGVGATMIVAVLLLVWLLPRPSAEYSVSQLDMFKSKPLDPSRWGWGKDGAKQPGETKQTPASGDGGQKSDQAQSSKNGESKSESSGQGKGSKEGGQGDGEKSSGGDKSQGGKSSGGKGTGKDKSSDGSKNMETGSDGEKEDSKTGDKSDAKSEGKQSGSKSKSESNSSGDKSQQQSSQQDSQSDSQSSQEDSQTESQDSDSSSSDSASSRPPPSSPSRITQWLSQISPTLGQIIQWIFYVLLILALIALAVLYRAQIVAAWKKLLAELRALWALWFGGPQPAAAADPVPAAAPPRPFSSYADPFSSGMAGQATLAELVRYTFEALEAWGREHDAPRAAGQTAHEYARQLGAVHQPLAREVRFLAELYGQLAYAQTSVRSPNVEPLRSLWQQLRLGAAGG